MEKVEYCRGGYGHMVHDYFVERVREKARERRKLIASLKSREDALKYRRNARKVIRKAFGGFPERTALNPVISGSLKRSGYIVEKVRFESRPGVIVTANLYMPINGKKRHPVVIAACGHSIEGKGLPRYQEIAQRLVHSGFMVLLYDPFHQGERDQYFGLEGENREELGRGCCFAHNMMGKQLELVGDFFGAWRAWDGIRALDYLLSRPEADSSRIGVTGNSGGGTMTAWLWALDDRFTMAAPSCFITTFLRNLENELPADSEQCPPGVIGNGIEMADFLIAQAPKPVLLIGQKYDAFDIRGFEESFGDVRKIYRLLGAQGEAACYTGDGLHGYQPGAQEKMVSFFSSKAGMRQRHSPPLTASRPRTLFAAENGQVMLSGAVPVFRKINETARQLKLSRKRPDGKKLAAALKGLLSIPAVDCVPGYRVLRGCGIKGAPAARYALETETNIRVILKKTRADERHLFCLEAEKELSLYLPHVSSEADAENREIPEELSAGGAVYLLDVRGLGESIPDEKVGFFHPYGMDYLFHAYSIMLGESYPGRRVYDCLCALNLLMDRGAEKIRLCGRGQGSVTALLAAVLHPGVRSLLLKNAPSSFEEWAGSPIATWPAANFPRGILELCDIEDCLRAFQGDVKIIEPWDRYMSSVRPRKKSESGRARTSG